MALKMVTTVWFVNNWSDINKYPVKDFAFRHYICSYNVKLFMVNFDSK